MSSILTIGDVELQLDGHRLVARGAPVHLTRKEFMILRQLMENAGRVVKIESDRCGWAHIRTVRGVGYIFDLPQDD